MSLEFDRCSRHCTECRSVVFSFLLLSTYLMFNGKTTYYLARGASDRDVKRGMYSLHSKLYVSFDFSRYIVFAMYLEKPERLTI